MALAALVGLGPGMVLNLRDPDDAVIVDAITEAADDIALEWRKDLAIRTANALAPHFKALAKSLGG